MYKVWTHYISMLLLTVLAGGSLYTSAYFFDIEISDPGALGATSLDGLALGEPFNEFICSIGTTVESEFTFENNNALPFTYDVAGDNFAGDGCGDISLKAFRNEHEVFAGPLLAFGVSGFDLESGASDIWRLELTKLSDAPNDTSCSFDALFDAYQQEFMSGEGFHDVEYVSANIITASSSLCAPTVLLQMDKHISGANEGFAESDFSFRVTTITGSTSVDVIVPHGGSYPLPEGTYMIEELAPPGFVHEDWRIGWYGVCERGDEFSTTITIDEGNIDHGWLDCQADNQYRPDQRQNAAGEGATAVSVPEDRTREPEDAGRRQPRVQHEPDPVPETPEVTEPETLLITAESTDADAESDHDSGAVSEAADGTASDDAEEPKDVSEEIEEEESEPEPELEQEIEPESELEPETESESNTTDEAVE